jgi:hypothetical protein
LRSRPRVLRYSAILLLSGRLHQTNAGDLLTDVACQPSIRLPERELLCILCFSAFQSAVQPNQIIKD